MVRSEWHELRISEDDMLSEQGLVGKWNSGGSYLEVVDNAFSIKVVVGDRKEVPVESLAPGIFLLG